MAFPVYSRDFGRNPLPVERSFINPLIIARLSVAIASASMGLGALLLFFHLAQPVAFKGLFFAPARLVRFKDDRRHRFGPMVFVQTDEGQIGRGWYLFSSAFEELAKS
jgi:hypothetical protein